MNRGRWQIIALTALLVSGCIPGPQDEPTPIVVATPANAIPDRPAMRGSRTVTLYLLQGGRLHPVQRPGFDTSPGNRVGLLLAGPTAAEAADGVRTAVAPGGVMTRVTNSAPDTAVAEASPGFARISGSDQLLAVAQVVWTLTEHPGTSLVSVNVDGTPLEVPTDRGLSRVPVGRSDYTSVAPLDRPSPSPSAGSPSPSTSSSRHSTPARPLPHPGRPPRGLSRWLRREAGLVP